jgi:hypothetical protein
VLGFLHPTKLSHRVLYHGTPFVGARLYARSAASAWQSQRKPILLFHIGYPARLHHTVVRALHKDLQIAVSAHIPSKGSKTNPSRFSCCRQAVVVSRRSKYPLRNKYSDLRSRVGRDSRIFRQLPGNVRVDVAGCWGSLFLNGARPWAASGPAGGFVRSRWVSRAPP